LSLAALCAALLAPISLPIPAQTASFALPGSPARVIVSLKADSPLLRQPALSTAERRTGHAKALGQRLGLAMSAGGAVSERAQVVFATGITSAELAQRLAREADVDYAVPDLRRRAYAAPNDPLYADGVPGNGPAVGQWYLRAPAGAVKSSLDIETAWSVTTGHPGVVVAVLDTGVRFDHPDLLAVAAGGNLLAGYDMVSDVELGNDGDGRDADATDPGDWVTATEANSSSSVFYRCTTLDPGSGTYSAQNSSWHGTQVSGNIAALANNGVGMAGVGPNLRVLPVRVLGKCGGGFDSDVIAGMRWAAGLPVPGVPANLNRAQVINMSLGGEGTCSAAYRDAVNAINAAGTVIVAAAGNSAGHAVGTPANCPGVIAVAALRHVGTKVGFSDLGPEITVGAPGGNCVNVTAGSPCLYPILTTSNSGTTTPVAADWTDSFNPSLGTSSSAPLVSGTAALMLSAQPTMTPQQIKLLLQATARKFPTTGGDNGDGTAVPQCTAPQYDANGQPIDQLQCYCATDTCGAGMLDAGAAVQAANAGLPVSGFQADGLWWNSPPRSESGWGINFAHQGDIIFATWFTFGADGKPWWLIVEAHKTAPGVYSGAVSTVTGPPFNSVPFASSKVVETVVGSATLTFADGDNATFAYNVNGIVQSKPITRQLFAAPLPSCIWGLQPDLALATNYQGLWWNAPSGSEAGWGINFSHQGDIVFATWFTYDADGKPWWLIAEAHKTAPGVYAGNVSAVTGPPFNSVPFDGSKVVETVVGTTTLTFFDGSKATFAYNVNGVVQAKSITRQVFAPPAGTVCR
jgi:serine protease